MIYCIRQDREFSGDSSISRSRSRALLLACAALVPATPALAQDEPEAADSQAAPADDDDFHGPVIVVTAGGLDRLDMLAGTSVLDGVELQRSLDGQIGELLA